MYNYIGGFNGYFNYYIRSYWRFCDNRSLVYCGCFSIPGPQEVQAAVLNWRVKMPNHHDFIRFYYPQNFDEAIRMIASLRDEVEELEAKNQTMKKQLILWNKIGDELEEFIEKLKTQKALEK